MSQYRTPLLWLTLMLGWLSYLLQSEPLSDNIHHAKLVPYLAAMLLTSLLVILLYLPPKPPPPAPLRASLGWLLSAWSIQSVSLLLAFPPFWLTWLSQLSFGLGIGLLLLALLRWQRRFAELQHRCDMLAQWDPATGLLTRRAFIDRLQYEEKRAQRHQQPLCLLLVHLCAPRRANSPLTRADKQNFIHAASQILRCNDLVASWQSDQLAILLSELDQQQGGIVANKLRLLSQGSLTESQHPMLIHIGGHVYHPAAHQTTKGDASTHAPPPGTLQHALRHANAALTASYAPGASPIIITPPVCADPQQQGEG